MASIARPMSDQSLFLRSTLQADAAVVLLAGAGCLAGAGPIAALTGMPAGVLAPLGIFLLAWSAWVGFSSTRAALSKRAAQVVMIVNVLWVVESLVLLFSGWVPLTQVGWWLVAAQAVAVDLFAVAQFFGLRRLP